MHTHNTGVKKRNGLVKNNNLKESVHQKYFRIIKKLCVSFFEGYICLLQMVLD
jgi:hypothetical protein